MLVRYPTLGALRAFEAAVRHKSFTRAASELNITQTAVSHQIKGLEALLGAKLFIRRGNAVELTKTAVTYYDTVQSSLLQLWLGTEKVMSGDRDGTLSILSPQTFASKVLFPNLKDFQRQQPGLRISIRSVLGSETPPRQDYDIAIRYGWPDSWPSWHSVRLTKDETFPVCSPAFLKAHDIRTPASLAGLTVIRSGSPLLPDDWPNWLRTAGVPNLRFGAEIASDLLFPALQAALEGLGVAIGRNCLVARDIAAGRLVKAVPIHHASDAGYFAISAHERSRIPHVQAFRDWLLAVSRALDA